jgi:hypothetical protein
MRETLRPMRVLLAVAAVLVLLAGIQLFGFSLRTKDFFAWTVANPLTAAFFGANFWGACVIEALGARERLWANARVAVWPVFVYTVAMVVVTLVYVDQFHLGPAFAVRTRVVAWGWLAIYVVVPVVMAVLLVAQLRVQGSDPPRMARPVAWLLGLIGVHAVLFLVLAVVLLVGPARGARWWPWALTPLTARATGAWLAGLGVAAVVALFERDYRRVRPAAWGYLVIAVLQSIALVRFPDRMHWSSPSAVIYVVVLATVAVAGIAGVIGATHKVIDPRGERAHTGVQPPGR